MFFHPCLHSLYCSDMSCDSSFPATFLQASSKSAWRSTPELLKLVSAANLKQFLSGLTTVHLILSDVHWSSKLQWAIASSNLRSDTCHSLVIFGRLVSRWPIYDGAVPSALEEDFVYDLSFFFLSSFFFALRWASKFHSIVAGQLVYHSQSMV